MEMFTARKADKNILSLAMILEKLWKLDKLSWWNFLIATTIKLSTMSDLNEQVLMVMDEHLTSNNLNFVSSRK